MSKYTQPQADVVEINGDEISIKFRPCSAKDALDVQLASAAPNQTLADSYAIALPFVEAHLVEYDGESVDASRDLPIIAVTGIAAKIVMYRILGKPKKPELESTPSQ